MFVQRRRSELTKRLVRMVLTTATPRAAPATGQTEHPLGEGRGRDRAGAAYGHLRASRPALAIAEVTAPAHRA